jgi:hypothetical protein
MDKPLEPGVRKKGRNTYQVSTEYLNEDFEKMGPEKFKQLMKDKKPKTMKAGGLSGGQAKLAAKAPPPDKIDAKDFAVLKAEKAKGRGMGLQDESVQPGKVQKAFLGKMIKGAGKSIGRLFGAKKSATATPGTVTMSKSGIGGEGGMLPQLLQKAIDDGIIKPASKGRMMKAFKGGGADMGLQDEKVKPGKVMKAKRGKFLRSDPTKPISSVQPSTTLPKDFVGKRKALGGVRASLGMLKGPAKAGAILGAALTVPVGKMLKKIQDKRKAKNRDEAKVKKMAGGMAKKYSKGGDLRAEYIHSQTKKNRKVTGEGYFTERSATRREEYGAAKDRYPNKMDRRKQMLKNLSRVLNPTMGVVKGTIDALNAPTTRKYSVGGGMMNKPMGYSSGSKLMDFIKSGSYTDKYGTKTNVDKAIKKINLSPKDKDLATMKPASDKKMMGGGMMQRPMGYKSGTMVKARGCKLGRTRPTKMY